MKLSALLEHIDHTLVSGIPDTDVTDICCDSRQVGEGSLFVALSGAVADGHTFIPAALAGGAAALVVEREVADIPAHIPVIRVADSRLALAHLAAAFYGWPHRSMQIVGVTGTKGKTTTTHILRSILMAAGHTVGMIGTLGAFIGTEQIGDGRNTTPESLEIHRLFRQMADAGCSHVVMEVSSQAMKLSRVAGIQFDVALFLNLSPDHIGGAEHADFDEYQGCKAALFSQCRRAVGNADDESWPVMAARIKRGHSSITFGLGEQADIKGKGVKPALVNGVPGVQFHIGYIANPFRLPMPGVFNAMDALAAYAVALTLGIPEKFIRAGMESTSVRGRTEVYPHGGDYTVLIDYAHNDVSFDSLLSTLKQYDHNRIIVVFGAGGDRPVMRRTDMARVAARYADFAVVTMDNPRTERVEDICAHITAALEGKIPSVEIYDRREAIFHALDMAQPGDIIALLGKGHEEYIEVNGVRSHFSEKEVLDEYFRR